MSEWWTYELSNFLLFSPRTYDRMLESYNAALWPSQIPAVLAGIAVVCLAARRGRQDSLAGAMILSLAWFWVAWAFHLERYTPINWAARWFALGFVAQGVMILATARVLDRDASDASRQTPAMRDRTPGNVAVAGLLLASFAMVALPLVERLLGRTWAQVEVFGLFPDATAIATLGILAARERLLWHLQVIPLVWCVVGSVTLAALGRADGWVIAVSALIAAVLFGWKVRTARKVRPSSVASA